MPDQPPLSKGLRDIPPDGGSEDDQANRRALVEAALAFGVSLKQLEEMADDAAAKG